MEGFFAFQRDIITDFAPLDEVAARQLGADRACSALRDALG